MASLEDVLLDAEKNAFIRHSLLKHDYVRRGTFDAHYYIGTQNPDALAQAGFYCTGGDSMECFSCGLVVKEWPPDRNAVTYHQEKSPNCRFIAGVDQSIKIAIPDNGLPPVYAHTPQDLRHIEAATKLPNDSVRIPRGVTCSPRSRWPNRNEIYSTVKIRLVIPPRTGGREGAQLVLDELKWIRTMRSERERRKTFNLFGSWPHVGSHSAENMARQGFYFLQFSDTVQCFACRLILSNLRRDKEAKDVHKKEMPSCPMVLNQCPQNVVHEAEPTGDELVGREFKDRVMCQLCTERERNVVCNPCKHFVMCLQCSARVDACPVCRTKPLEKMVIYPS